MALPAITLPSEIAMYANTEELMTEMRRAIKNHPAETQRLQQIASLARRDLAKGAAAFAAWQRAIGMLPPDTERAGDALPTSPARNASGNAAVPDTPPATAAGRRDDAARLRAQIASCLQKEPHPALRMFLERLRRDSHKYPAGFLQQELEVYLQAANPDDFLNRLAALHWQWTLEDVAADPDGNWLKRGDTHQRQAVLARLRDAFGSESDLLLRCHLAALARESVTNPADVDNRLNDYFRNRTDPNWVWRATVHVAGSPEAAFRWSLHKTRQKVTDARLLGYLDGIEQTAQENLPLATGKLTAFVELVALLDGETNAP